MSNPTKVFARGKFPFAIVSSSVTTGYAATLSASFAPGYDITNYHQDNYASFENEPAQGPFTETHVGGNQHRHVPLNDGTDNILTRAEVFHINLDNAGEIRLYGPDFFDTAAPRASYLRGNSAKSPLNIANIQTTTGSNVLGNFTHNYEVVQTQGRKLNNRYFVEVEGDLNGATASPYVLGVTDRELPDRDGGKSVIAERFNAPGGPDVSSRGVLDVEAEEYAPNNALPFRNQLVRGPLQNLLSAHTDQFGLSSITSGSANFHKVNRNTLCRVNPEDTSSFEQVYDNWYVQHAIPQTDVQYSWITASSETSACELGGYQRNGAYTNRGGAFTDITFVSQSEVTGNSIDVVDHIGINTPDKQISYISEFNNTHFRDRRSFIFDGQNRVVGDVVEGINLGTGARWGKYIGKEAGQKFSFSFWIRVDESLNGQMSLVNLGSVSNLRLISGSFGQNSLRFALSPPVGSAGFWETDESVLKTESDGQPLNEWHFVVVSHDANLATNVPNLWIDGVPKEMSLNTAPGSDGMDPISDNEHVLFGYADGEPDLIEPISGAMAEVAFWADTLTDKEVDILWNATRDKDPLKAPRQFDEHQITKQFPTLQSKVVAWYSGHGEGQNQVPNEVYEDEGFDLNPVGNAFLDVAGKFDLHGSYGLGVTREDVPIISYSSWGNGPFNHPSWKQIRGWEHPVSRYLRRNNIVSVADDPKQIIISQGDTQISVKARRGNTVSNFVEPPVTSKYRPIEHNVILKGTINPLVGHRIRHTYANNLVSYGNKRLNKKLSRIKREEQMYDRLREFYLDPDFEEEANPINKFLTLTYSEVIYPKEENTYLGKIRGRQNYILDLPGLSENGYDRTFGTQRAFWRNDIDERHRTIGVTGAYNSQDYSYLTGTVFGTELSGNDSTNGDLSLFPLDVRQGLKYREYTVASTIVRGRIAADYGGELNYQEWYFGRAGSGSSAPPNTALTSIHYINPRIAQYRGDGFIAGAELLQKPRAEYVAFLAGWYYDTTDAAAIGETASFDAGLQWRTAELAGKNPWYDSYEDYAQDVRVIGKDCSVLPEFNISEHMEYFLLEAGGNFRRQNNAFLNIDGVGIRDASAIDNTERFDNAFYATYAHSDLLRDIDKIRDDHKDLAELSKVTLKCKGIKKLLPYNGFYPQQRTVQLASLLSQSIGTYITGGYLEGNQPYSDSDLNSDPDSEIVRNSYLLSLLQPFYAPGIMFNSIKSGIAVDWPTYTGSAPTQGFSLTPDIVFGDAGNPQQFSFKGFFTQSPTYRFPFESLIFPNIGIPKKDEISVNTTGVDDGVFFNYPTNFNLSTNPNAFFIWNHQRDFRYELAASNFVAEVPKFFLKDQSLVSFTSETSSKWKTFESNKTYYMDVVLRKTEDIVMMESYRSEIHETGAFGERATGRYFGFPLNISASAPNTGIYDAVTEPWRPGQHCDPAYAAYTPPYHEGETIARISFNPTVTRKYTLEEVFADAEVQNIFTGLTNYTGSVAEEGAMPVDSSVNYFGKVLKPILEFNLEKSKKGVFSNQTARDDFNEENQAWVISPRWECPVLDFTEQEGDVSDELVTTSSTDNALANLGDDYSKTGFGRGMWSGYGDLLEGNKGIYLEIRDSFPQKIKDFKNTLTGSLLDQVGFRPTSERVGELADEKIISEAIVAIPFLDEQARGTTEIDCKHLIKIPREVFDLQRQNFNNGEPAIKVGDLGSSVEIRSTSITNMIDIMEEYYIPPQFNFLEFEDIDPFVMYLFEFETTLDKQDLADIWQGVMPKPAMIVEKDEIEFSHPAGQFEFFQGNPLPKNLRWMIFKVKKKAEKNYFAVTADSTDDDRFQFDFEVGRRAPEYSYNWPYDYFSLVELAKVEVEVEYKNDDRETKLTQKAPNVTAQELTEVARNKRNTKRGGKKKTLRRGINK
jgi:hypothetical protein